MKINTKNNFGFSKNILFMNRPHLIIKYCSFCLKSIKGKDVEELVKNLKSHENTHKESFFYSNAIRVEGLDIFCRCCQKVFKHPRKSNAKTTREFEDHFVDQCGSYLAKLVLAAIAMVQILSQIKKKKKLDNI